MATQTWHPPRWLSQLEAVSARNLLLADAAPPPAAYFSLCVPRGAGGQCYAVYRSEAVSGTISPEWMPLSWPLDLQLGSLQSEVVLALHQLDAASCAAAAPSLSMPHFWPGSTPACTLQQQPPPQAQPAGVPAQGSTCSGGGEGSGEAAQLREAGEGAVVDATVPGSEVASADRGGTALASEPTAGTGGSLEPSGEAGPKSEALPPSPEAAQQLEQQQQQQQQQQEEEEDRGGGPSKTSDASPAAAAAAAPVLDSFPPDLFPGQVLAAWVVDLNRLHPVGEDLAAAAVGPSSILLEMEDGAYMYPPPAEEPAPSQQSSPSKRSTTLGGERLQPSAGSSPAGSAPRRLATLLMSKLMRSTPNLQEAVEGRAPGGPAGDSDEEWEAVSEASASSRFTTHTVPRESSTLLPPPSGISMSASSLTKSLSVSELQLSAAALVGLRSSILQLHGRALELRGRLEKLVEDRQAALEQEQQVREAVRAGQRARQRAQQVQAQLGKLQQELGAASKEATVRAQALVTTLKVMQASDRRLRDAQESLQGGQGRERLTGLHRELVARRCLMVSDLGRIFQLGPITVKVLEAPPGGYLEDRLERQWTGGAATSSSTPTSTSAPLDDGSSGGIKSAGAKLQLQAAFPGSSGFDELAPNGGSSALGTPRQYRQEVRLSICGVELRPAVWRAAFEDVGSDITAAEDEAAAVALGYVVQMVQRLSAYLDVPLRYPLRYLGSKSSILDGTPPIGTWSLATGPAKRTLFGRSESSAGEAAAAAGLHPTEYPLHCGGRRERAQFAVGVFLLNKDVMQLLQAHGISAGGPNQLLNNLYKLLLAARSALPQHS